MSVMCMSCGTTDEYDFSSYHNKWLCDDCLSVLNYYYDEAQKEMKRLKDTPESDFLEALQEYVSYKGDKYNEELRKERTDGDI